LEPTRYDKMIYNRAGISGIKLPAISLGLWQNFGDADVYHTMIATVKAAFNNGITHFDLANNYGQPVSGSAEENFGKMLETVFSGYRDEMFISTKAGYNMWPGPYGDHGSRKYMLSSLDQSLNRMGIDYVDVFYSHRPDPETPIEETMGALDTAVRRGKALYVGISNYNAEQSKEAIKVLKQLGTPCLLHQPRYNMFDRWIEGELVDVLKEEGVGSIAFSPLAQGMLTTRYLGGIPEDSRVAKNRGSLNSGDITKEKVAKAQKLNNIADQRGQTLAQMALVWALKVGNLTSVLIGASKSKQIVENVKALDNMQFTKQELSEIEEVLK